MAETPADRRRGLVERTATYLALIVALAWAGSLLTGLLIAAFDSNSEGLGVMKATAEVVGAPLGVALGYYFGKRSEPE